MERAKPNMRVVARKDHDAHTSPSRPETKPEPSLFGRLDANPLGSFPHVEVTIRNPQHTRRGA
jgi:hypothetical protein